MKRVLFNTIFLALLLAPALAEAIPAFPSAEGAGAVAVGGREGAVIEVRNLEDSGPGSFRACVEATGPRTCVFRMGGTITLRSYVFIRNPYLTIAGQTAPGGGIQIRGHGIYVSPPAHDIVVRYIRHRRGFANTGTTESDVGFEISSGSSASRPSSGEVYNVIVDHSSFGWQQDDNGTWGKVRNVTYQWSIFAEGNPAESDPHPGGKGLLVGTPPEQGRDMGAISLHHNYLVSNYLRNPAVTGYGPTELVNNVIYNWGAESGTQIQSRGGGAAMNIIGNYYKPGPDTVTRHYEVLVDAAGRYGGVREQSPQMMYMKDNLGPHRTSSAQAEWDIVGYCRAGAEVCTNEAPAPTSFQRNSPWPPSAHPITVSPAEANVANVLNNVGATLPARDALDARLVSEYHSGTGSLGGDNNWPVLAAGTPPADADHDGMSDEWERAKGLDPNNAADRNTIAPANNGYTNLEVYLADIAGEWMAEEAMLAPEVR